MKYRDLGVTEASGGAMRAQVMATTGARTEPTGWHYHECDGQFVYVLKGWVDLNFEDGTSIRLKANESLYLPGGFKHQETATSDELEILEVAVPADLGTVQCESPLD
jgi:quercetin dioxygenase-like cupin family protein